MCKLVDCFIWYRIKIFERVVICFLCRNKQIGNGFDKIWEWFDNNLWFELIDNEEDKIKFFISL